MKIISDIRDDCVHINVPLSKCDTDNSNIFLCCKNLAHNTLFISKEDEESTVVNDFFALFDFNVLKQNINPDICSLNNNSYFIYEGLSCRNKTFFCQEVEYD